jgi:hypothetical protein
MSFHPEFQSLSNAEFFSITDDKRHRLGSLGISADGRLFRYGLVGGTTIAAGKLTQSEVPASTSDELAVAAAAAIGSRAPTVTVDLTDGDLIDGYMNIEDDTGEGHLYSIKNNTDDGTTTTVTLADGHGLVVAITTVTTVGLWQNPWKDLVIQPSPPTAMVTGVTPRSMTTLYYGWIQTGGLCSVLIDGTVVIAAQVMPSNGTDGAVEAWGLTDGTPNVEITPQIGVVHEVAATTEHGTIWLNNVDF